MTTISSEYGKGDSSTSEHRPLKVFSPDGSRSNPNLTQKDTTDLLHEISLLLDTGVHKDTITLCLKLFDNGINPEALANTIRELKETSISQGNKNMA
ncbi:mitotic-spindle organizing gamma-tubulin ring associated-domain-containing protein [Lipomyces chichibuensis]|uniref:mitotic-spindle organizing gamma-tubulin ring associated-domain-containing protein n=1 Tax=Lipomyces chichibuensis TaxID=1546026 RepID=UPI003342F76E